MISIVIQGCGDDCFDTCLCKDRKEIESISPFFKDLIYKNQEIITLIEEEPSDAFTFLTEVLRNRGKVLATRISDNKWNFYWAKLSQKWQISEFVLYYSNEINSFIQKMLSSLYSVEISGASGALSTAINGTYESFQSSSDSKPSYKKSNKSGDEDILLEYNELKKLWTIKSMERSRTNTAGAYVDCNSYTTPDKIENQWKIWNTNRWEYDYNIRVKLIAKKVELSKDEKRIFWEMIELRFKNSYPQHDNHIMTCKSDLLWVLADHKELWCEDAMKNILDADDWCSLSMKLASFQK